MNILKKLKMYLSIMICYIIICIEFTTCLAATNTPTTVKVGFFSFDGYHEMDENGLRSGYGYEILQHMAGYANFRYEYVGYDKNWSEMQEMLEKGEIDILTSAQQTHERLALFDFSTTNIGVSSAILTAKSGDTKFLVSDYENWNGMRVGMIEGNSRNESFAEYARQHGFSYTPVYFDSTDSMVNALKYNNQNVKIDTILTSNLRKTDDEAILAQFNSAPFYVMVKKGNINLLDKINYAISQMDSNEPGLRTKLMNKYYAVSNKNNIVFSPEERKYIESMKDTKLKAVINPDRAPYSWLENGERKGIIYDAAKEVIERSGLNIEFIDVKNRQQYEHIIEIGEADIRFDAEYNTNRAETDGYWLTNSYVTVPVGKLFLKNKTTFKAAAVPKNRDMINAYGKKLENDGLKVTYYDSVDEITKSIMSGKQDIAFLAIDSATVAVRDDVTNKLACEEIFGDDISYTVAINQNQSELLFSVINKTVASLGEHEIDLIRQRYIANYKKPFTVIGFFYSNPVRVVIILIVVLVLITMLFALIFLAKRRKAENEYLAKEQKQNLLLKDALISAEKAGEAKSQFLSRVSHEMRTPLNAIIGFIELARGADKEQTENYLASSDIAAKQLLNVINDVLDMSSIESGKMKIANAPFNFKHLISSITNLYGTQCKQKNLSYETKINTPLDDWLIGDELRLNQILMNLLGNSVKFTSKGHIWLSVSQTAIKEDKVFLRFEISDTGCGMSSEMKERLFKPFEQESATTAKKYGGSGLGLSIVKNLTSMMNGKVRVESEQDKGTSFIIDLPFEVSKIKKEIQMPEHIDKLRVLAVDDELAERDYMAEVLTRMNVRFTCVNSGDEAISELSKAEKENDIYNVCLVDWKMPKMDGFDTTSKIRRKYGKDVVVIIVSAYDFEKAGDKAKAAGANLFLSKPVFQSSLFDLLMTLTGEKIAKSNKKIEAWDFPGKRVLVAEDNILNQIVLKGYLAKYNVVVDIAENGEKVVELFKKSEPGYYDAILMDIQMPVMDGYDATKAIRNSEHKEAKTIQIIAQTADAFNEDIAKAISVGMNFHISKPIDPDTLAKALSKAFQKKTDI